MQPRLSVLSLEGLSFTLEVSILSHRWHEGLVLPGWEVVWPGRVLERAPLGLRDEQEESISS